MTRKSKLWEYHVQTVGGFFTVFMTDKLEEMLNEWCEDGWEVVSTHIIENANKINVITKRLLTDCVHRERSRLMY